MDIGEKLRQLRLQRGLTQEDMADRCELSKGFISQVERNLASPSIATLTDMLECLGSSLSLFFKEDKDEKTVFSFLSSEKKRLSEEPRHSSISVSVAMEGEARFLSTWEMKPFDSSHRSAMSS